MVCFHTPQTLDVHTLVFVIGIIPEITGGHTTRQNILDSKRWQKQSRITGDRSCTRPLHVEKFAEQRRPRKPTRPLLRTILTGK